MNARTTWVTTSTLLRELREFGSDAAWRRFVRRFQRPVVAFARSLQLGPLDAEDVAQETLVAFADALRQGQYVRERGRLSHWLFGIARRQVQQHRKREARRSRILARDEASVDSLPDARVRDLWSRSWDAFVTETCLSAARAEFSHETYRAFELVVVHERTPQEAAAALGVDVKAVYNAKHRVLKRVRALHEDLESPEDA